MAISGFTNSVDPDMRRVTPVSADSPLSAAAIWPLTMLGRCGVAACAAATASRYRAASWLPFLGPGVQAEVGELDRVVGRADGGRRVPPGGAGLRPTRSGGVERGRL